MKKIYHKFRSVNIIFIDIILSLAAWIIAFNLRFNFDIPNLFKVRMYDSLIIICVVQILVFWCFNVHKPLWRFLSFIDIKNFFFCIIINISFISLILFVLMRSDFIPRSVLIIYPFLLICFGLGARLFIKFIFQKKIYISKLPKKNVLIVGAGSAAEKLTNDLRYSDTLQVTGFVDDDPNKLFTKIHGFSVLGEIKEINRLALENDVRLIIMAIPSADSDLTKRVLTTCKKHNLNLQTVPSVDEILSGKQKISQLRSLNLDDLLGRSPAIINLPGLEKILKKSVVLVTGAGGTIGSELCRQLSKFKPKLLILLDISEYQLYKIDTEFSDQFSELNRISLVGDVKSDKRIEEILKKYSPNFIFHAAAYKHVPLMEKNNSWEAFSNNVYGTVNLAKKAILFEVEKFIYISSDKAVNPTNVMGVTKKIAELLCLEFNNLSPNTYRTKFIITRFGNVLGSTGSVVPRFREQILRGGPVTITHKRIKRFFMSISEASQLVLQASIMGNGNEIFVLDMGKPILIETLAKQMIDLSGVGKDRIKIELIGLRPGEKLEEELFSSNEILLPTNNKKLKLIVRKKEEKKILSDILKLISLDEILVESKLKLKLKEWVPEYKILD